MSSLLTLPIAQIGDANGRPIPGAQLYTYASGTSTPLATYVDEGLTTPHANPVVADAAGRLPAVWLNGASYKLVLKTASGATLWTADPVNSSVAASGITFTSSLTGAVARSLTEKLSEMPSVKDFGAVGNGSTDDTAAFNAALALGRSVRIPVGTYKITAPLTGAVSGSGLIGDGRNAILAPSYTSGDVFTLGNGSAEISGLIFRDFRIWPSVTMTSGWVFNGRLVTDSVWENVYIGSTDDWTANGSAHRLYGGIYFDRFSQCVVSGGEIVASWKGIACRGNADQSYGVELSIGGGARILAPSVAGIHIGGASGGVYVDRIDISLARKGILIDSTLQSGAVNREVFLNNVVMDSCTGWGLDLQDNAVTLLEMDGAWIASCGSVGTGEGGMRVAPSSGTRAEIKMSDCTVHNNWFDGVQLNEASAIITGCKIRNNGHGANGGHGIYVVTDEVIPLTVVGNYIHNNGAGNAARGYGLRIEQGTNIDFIVTNNNFSGNAQGAVYNLAGGGGRKIVRDNVGFRTEMTGRSVIASGTAAVTVNHSLGVTPDTILISLAGALDANTVLYADPAEITSTDIVFRSSANQSIDRAFYWRASFGAN